MITTPCNRPSLEIYKFDNSSVKDQALQDNIVYCCMSIYDELDRDYVTAVNRIITLFNAVATRATPLWQLSTSESELHLALLGLNIHRGRASAYRNDSSCTTSFLRAVLVFMFGCIKDKHNDLQGTLTSDNSIADMVKIDGCKELDSCITDKLIQLSFRVISHPQYIIIEHDAPYSLQSSSITIFIPAIKICKVLPDEQQSSRSPIKSTNEVSANNSDKNTSSTPFDFRIYTGYYSRHDPSNVPLRDIVIDFFSDIKSHELLDTESIINQVMALRNNADGLCYKLALLAIMISQKPLLKHEDQDILFLLRHIQDINFKFIIGNPGVLRDNRSLKIMLFMLYKTIGSQSQEEGVFFNNKLFSKYDAVIKNFGEQILKNTVRNMHSDTDEVTSFRVSLKTHLDSSLQRVSSIKTLYDSVLLCTDELIPKQIFESIKTVGDFYNLIILIIKTSFIGTLNVNAVLNAFKLLEVNESVQKVDECCRTLLAIVIQLLSMINVLAEENQSQAFDSLVLPFFVQIADQYMSDVSTFYSNNITSINKVGAALVQYDKTVKQILSGLSLDVVASEKQSTELPLDKDIYFPIRLAEQMSEIVNILKLIATTYNDKMNAFMGNQIQESHHDVVLGTFRFIVAYYMSVGQIEQMGSFYKAICDHDINKIIVALEKIVNDFPNETAKSSTPDVLDVIITSVLSSNPSDRLLAEMAKIDVSLLRKIVEKNRMAFVFWNSLTVPNN